MSNEVNPKATPPQRSARERIDAAAKALYDFQVQAARTEIDSSQFDLAELEEFILNIRRESPTAQILVFFSYLDDRIQKLLQGKLLHIDSNNAVDRMFGLNAPLDTSSSRTLIAFHLGWLSRETKLQLDAFRKVRNEFAHRAFRASLSEPGVSDLVEAIGHDDTLNRVLDVLRDVSKDESQFPDLSRNRLLCRLLLLALRTFEDLLVLPATRQYKVPAAAIVAPWDEAPKLLKRLRLAATKAVMLCVGEELETGVKVW